MKWESLSQFLAMGGYGGFVWGSYGVALAVLVLEIVLVRRRFRAARAAAARQQEALRGRDAG
jgi:heme exporter protein D